MMPLGPRAELRAVTGADVAQRNRELYDTMDDRVWHLAVYQPVFGGARYINMGGELLARDLATMLKIAEGAHVLDLGCGTGDLAVRLTALTGAHITGVEVNRRQAERAREAAKQCRRGSLTVIETDAADWTPDRHFAAGYSADTLMLVPSWPAFLSAARHAIAEDGNFVASMILGSELTDAERQYFWEEDGFVMLPNRTRASELFATAGFRNVTWAERNDWALKCLSRIFDSVMLHREQIEASVGAAGWRDWLDVNAAYLDCFRSGKMEYVIAVARS